MSEPHGEGPQLEAGPGLVVRWDGERLAAYRQGGDVTPAWDLDGSLSPGHSALRVLAAALEDGSVLLLAAARPVESSAHDGERVAALLIDREGAAEESEEVLLSTEYAADGAIRRTGMEIYRAGEDYPLRAAGDTTGSERDERDELRTERAAMSFRLDGLSGRAVYEIVHTV